VYLNKPVYRQGLVAAIFLILMSTGWIDQGAAGPTLTQAAPGEERSLFWVPFATQAQLRVLSASLDIWTVNQKEHLFLAYLSPVEAAWLADQGITLSRAERAVTGVGSSPADQPETIPNFPCYRSIAELEAGLEARAARFPELAEIISIGSSYEGRPLQVIRLTNRQLQTTKPALFVMANIHGRELITPEVAMAFVDRLLQGYGSDPDITWMLDDQEIHVLVSANPDGHVKNEPGEPWALWRKNTQPYGSCSPSTYGVDLNRNFSFDWGCCGGSSPDPCEVTFRGPSSASETETRAMQEYLRALFPDRRGPGIEEAAPEDTQGLFVSLHSFGNMVLWPWGSTDLPAPNGPAFEVLGRKLAAFNAYAPGQAASLYPTDGTADEWIYGELGVPAYTFEIGGYEEDPDLSFYPSCDRHPELIQPNLEALLYAARVARAPYLQPRGPEISAYSLTNLLPDGQVAVQVEADDTGGGGQAIAAAEVYVNQPPWEGGIPVQLEAADGVLDSAYEVFQGKLALEGEEQAALFIRSQDQTGVWGPVYAFYYSKPEFSYLPALFAAESP
jgi:hypothetical protein